MSSAILTPFDFSEPVRKGRRRFWKQILPVTSIDYNGQKVDFDESFHKELELSFSEGAYDQVPLVFADADNRHNMDPRNFGGEVLDMEYRGANKGTWALIEADPEARKIINKNPKLGVSARIVQNVKKADGRFFKKAVNHVLLTMNPRVSGMEPWQAVDLSDEDTVNEVVDLTAVDYEEGSNMGTKVTKTKASTASRQIDLSSLSDEEFQSLLDLAATMVDDEAEVDEDEEDDESTVENTTTTPPPATKKKSKTKVTVEEEHEGDDDEEPEDDEEEDEDDSTDLSDAEKVRRSSDHSTVRSMQIDLAEAKWQGQRQQYAAAGVPPFLLDLAEPVLKQPEAMTIDLSEDESVDATATIRKMLDGFKGLIDLTPEIGHQIDLSEKHQTTEDDQFLKAWDEQYG